QKVIVIIFYTNITSTFFKDWTDAGVLQQSGIKTPDGTKFVGSNFCNDPDKYGYRLGSKEEIEAIAELDKQEKKRESSTILKAYQTIRKFKSQRDSKDENSQDVHDNPQIQKNPVVGEFGTPRIDKEISPQQKLITPREPVQDLKQQIIDNL